MIIKCTEKEREYILAGKCPNNFIEIEKNMMCENKSCAKCYEDFNIKFEIVEDKENE